MQFVSQFRKSTPEFGRTFLALTALAFGACSISAQEIPAPIAPLANAPLVIAPSTALAPNAIILLGADGVSYFRVALDDKADLAAKTWLTQRATDSVSRIAPDGSGVMVRRDRRNKDAEIVQQLWLVTPKPDGTPDETPLPLDADALAAARGWNGYRLRSISGLQWPQGQNRALLRLTYGARTAVAANDKTPETKAPDLENADAKTADAKAPDAITPEAKAPDEKTPDEKTPAAPDEKIPDVKVPDVKTPEPKSPEAQITTQEILGWYDLGAKTFSPIFQEPRLVGVEISPDGKFIHVLAQRGDGDATALLLDAQGKEQPSKTLQTLRAVGYLYKGWIDDSHILLKKSGQNQLVILDARRDEVAAPLGLNPAFSASVSPDGASALVFADEGAIATEIPRAIGAANGAPLDWKIEGELPIRVAAWSADSRFALLLQGAAPRGAATRATLLSFAPFSARPIALPGDVAVSAARFVYPNNTPE